MSTNEQEQRKSFRCPVSDEAQDAEIKTASFRMRVRLYNESAGGFAVISEQPFLVKCGDIVELRTGGGCYEARVVHMARPGLGDPANGWVRRPSYQLGLERVREISHPSSDELPRATWWGSLPRHWLNPFRSSSLDFLSLLLVVALIPTAVALFGWSYHRPLLKWLTQSDRAESAESADEALDLSVPAQPGGTPPAAGAQGGGAAATLRAESKPAAKTPPSLAALRRTVHRLPDASAFAVPEIAEHLSLDYAQKWQVGRLVEATRKALEKIDHDMVQAAPEARERSRRSVQETAREKAERLLSNQQRERWAALTGSDASNP